MKPWIVITGSSGLIGNALLQKLASDFEIAALDISPPRSLIHSENVKFFRIDLGDSKVVSSFFIQNPRPILGLINLAAYYNFLNTHSNNYDRLKDGLIELSRAFKSLRVEHGCFIQASSMACLNPVNVGTLIDSSAQSHPRWEYPKFKKESEDILRNELRDEHYVEMVIAGVYTDFCELVPLYQFIDAHLKFKIQRFFYPGDGQQGLTYVHLDDVCDAFQQQLFAARRSRRLLLGESEATTYKQIADIVDLEFLGFVLPKIRVTKWLARFGAFCVSKLIRKSFYQPWMIDFSNEHYQFDLSGTFEQLGWRPTRRLKDELPAIVRRALDQPKEWKTLNGRRPWHESDWPHHVNQSES